MFRTFVQFIIAGLVLVAFAQRAQAQYWGEYSYHPQQFALLNALARQGVLYQQAYAAQSSCHPTRHGYTSGYGQSGDGNSYADLQVASELAHARAFWEKRRLRQQYLDEERQRRGLTEQDVAARREHVEASRQMVALNREAAIERTQRQSPDRPDLQEVNPASGVIHWPVTLQDARFAAERGRLETIFVQRCRYQEAASESSTEIPHLTRAMTDTLKSMVHELPSSEYVATKSFLKKLEYESRFAPPAAGLAAR